MYDNIRSGWCIKTRDSCSSPIEICKNIVGCSFPVDVEILAPSVFAPHRIEIASVAHRNRQAGIAIPPIGKAPEREIEEPHLREENLCRRDRYSELYSFCGLWHVDMQVAVIAAG
jgi:hypothetical protein